MFRSLSNRDFCGALVWGGTDHPASQVRLGSAAQIYFAHCASCCGAHVLAAPKTLFLYQLPTCQAATGTECWQTSASDACTRAFAQGLILRCFFHRPHFLEATRAKRLLSTFQTTNRLNLNHIWLSKWQHESNDDQCKRC